jgi:hypothetical protein
MEDSLDELEGVATPFPLACTSLGISVFNLLLA